MAFDILQKVDFDYKLSKKMLAKLNKLDFSNFNDENVYERVYISADGVFYKLKFFYCENRKMWVLEINGITANVGINPTVHDFMVNYDNMISMAIRLKKPNKIESDQDNVLND